MQTARSTVATEGLSARRRARDRLVVGAAGGIARMPTPVRLALTSVLGPLAFAVSARRRRVPLGNLAIAYPDRSEAWRRRIARRCLAHSLSELMFVIRMPRLRGEALERLCVNLDELHAALREDLSCGKGVVLLGAHLGNPTLLAALATRVAPVSGLGTPYARSVRQAAYLDELRTRLGLAFVPYDEWPVDLLHALRRNEIVSLMTDQRPGRGRRFVWVDFFGARARTIAFPADLARLAGAVMRPIYMVREGRRYRAIVHPPVPAPDKAAGEAGLRRAAAAWTAALQREVDARPEQWGWTLRRWQQSSDEPSVPERVPPPAPPL